MKTALKLFLVSLLILPACNRTSPDTTRAASEDRSNANEQMKRDRDDYVTMMNAKLAEFDQKLDGLDERAAAMKGPEKDNFKNAITRLRDQRKAVADKLSELKSVNVESWQTLRGEIDSAWADLHRSYEQVAKEYEKGAPVRKTS